MFGILRFFPGNLKLYEVAFIHKSASVISKTGQTVNNERLEFLGDAILDAIIADHLYSIFPNKDEGFLTQLRSKIVKRKQLNKLAIKIGISSLLVSNTNSEQSKQNLLGNALEALIGAIYLDKGYRRTQRFVIHMIMKRHLDLEKIARKESDFKSRLIEWAQKNKYDIRFISMEDDKIETDDNVFVSRVMITGQQLGFGKGLSKKDAEQQAAEQALDSVLEELK
jgi:ribonuclease III